MGPLLTACFGDPGELEACTFTDPTYCAEPDAPATGLTTGPTTGSTSAETATGEAGSEGSGKGAGTETSGTEGSSSTGTPADPPPQVIAFTVETGNATPGQIFDAGAVQLALLASDDVVEVDLLYGDTLVTTLPIAAFPYAFDITSRNMCDGSRTFTAIVRDAEGQTDMGAAPFGRRHIPMMSAA